jgi:hypothetical protein
MALTKVQQEVWSNTMVELFETMTVAGRVVNRNVIADTRADKWHITAGADVSVASVADGSDITYDALTDTETTITPTFDKAFSLMDLDTNKVETAIDYMPTYLKRGAYKLADGLDEGILGLHAQAGTDFYESGSTAWQFTKDTCADMPGFLGKLSKVCKDNDWPDAQEKYLIAPSGFKEAVLTYTGGRESALGDSALTAGRADAFLYGGFNVFISNNLATASTVTHGLCGLVGDGIALGVQVDPSSMESMRAESRFGTLYRGRMKAGYKVYRSSAVIDVNFNEVVVATS